MAPLCRTGRGHLFGTTLKSRKTLNRPFVTLVADPSLVEERLQRHLTWRTWSTTWREHIHLHAPTLWMYVLSELQWQKQLLQNTLTALHFKKVQTSTEVQKPHSNNYRIGWYAYIDLRISVIGRQLLKLCFLYQVRSGSFFFPNAPVSASPMDPRLRNFNPSHLRGRHLIHLHMPLLFSRMLLLCGTNYLLRLHPLHPSLFLREMFMTIYLT